jgi:hypothetical protein
LATISLKHQIVLADDNEIDDEDFNEYIEVNDDIDEHDSDDNNEDGDEFSKDEDLNNMSELEIVTDLNLQEINEGSILVCYNGITFML